MMITCTRILEFDAAHRVMRHESKCSTLHGHRYKVEITCGAESLDGVGRVVDFGVVKQVVGQWIDNHLDHTTLLNREDTALVKFCMEEATSLGKREPWVMSCEPTAENIAVMLLEVARGKLTMRHGLQVLRVRVWETPNCFAEAQGL